MTDLRDGVEHALAVAGLTSESPEVKAAVRALAPFFFEHFKQSLFRARTCEEWERDADKRLALIRREFDR